MKLAGAIEKIGEKRLQTPRSNRRSGKEIWHEAYPKPTLCGTAQRLHVVARQNRTRPHLKIKLRDSERPRLQLAGVRVSKPDRKMMVQILRPQRSAVLGQIIGSGTKQHPKRPQGTRREPGVRQVAASNRDVYSLINEIHDEIIEIDIKFDVWKSLDKFRDHWEQQVIAHQWDAYTKPTVWCGKRVSKRRSSVFEIVENPFASIMEEPTFFRQTKTSGRSLKEPYSKVPLQSRHGLTYS